MTVPFPLKALLYGPHGRLEDRANNFTALRLGFALVIVYGHAVMLPVGLPLTGAWATGVDAVVQYALDGFFILSGYMLTAGLMRGTSMPGFAAARILRIFPGLIAAVLVCWLFIGPLATTLDLPDYLTRAQTWLFPVAMIGQINPEATLPGVFEAQAFAKLDGPLWTIRYELACYAGAGILAALGVWRRAPGVLAIAAVAAAWSVIESVSPYEGFGDDSLYAAARFGGAFMVGAAFYALRDRIALGLAPTILLALAALVLSQTPLAMIAGQIALAQACLWLGFANIRGRVGGAVREVEDISYGVYILHWPAGQILVSAFPDLPVWLLFIAMTLSAVTCGWLLRVTVEKPALAMRPALASRLARLAPSAATPDRRRPL